MVIHGDYDDCNTPNQREREREKNIYLTLRNGAGGGGNPLPFRERRMSTSASHECARREVPTSRARWSSVADEVAFHPRRITAASETEQEIRSSAS